MKLSFTSALGALVMLLWPVLVLTLHAQLGSWPLLIVGAALLAWRLPQARALAIIAGLVLVSMGLLGHAELGMRAYPIAISLIMLTLFAGSLIRGMPIIERLARVREPDLPSEGVIYTRRVTWAWCGFFVVNGGISAWTALYADLATWTLYNGFISYCLMGLMFAGEWVCRRHVRGAAA
ncbi:COG4648 family protein [Pseudomonas saliphila]|uniref:COG4648 family protein n=1 Tax=Pseudomonas saliphila TaxID=2586906 RepID=UPI0019D4F579|nr:hypothetical protein [Pseudomonas saliphila]